MDENDPRARLLALAEQRGVSLSALSALIGRNASYLQQFVRKGSPRKLEEGDRRTLAEFFGVSEVELGGSDRMPVPVPAKASAKPPAAAKVRSEWIDVPRLALGASAGPGALADSERPIGMLRFDPRWLRHQGLSAGQLSAIGVEGDSMFPTLRDGDEILVDRSRRDVRDGIHVIRLDDTLLVKRLERGPQGRVLIKSDNPAYASAERPVEDVEIVGRVVWKGGRL